MKTPITPIRLPLDLKARIRARESNVSQFIIESIKDQLAYLDLKDSWIARGKPV